MTERIYSLSSLAAISSTELSSGISSSISSPSGDGRDTAKSLRRQSVAARLRIILNSQLRSEPLEASKVSDFTMARSTVRMTRSSARPLSSTNSLAFNSKKPRISVIKRSAVASISLQISENIPILRSYSLLSIGTVITPKPACNILYASTIRFLQKKFVIPRRESACKGLLPRIIPKLPR